jgi:hypothetical protein
MGRPRARFERLLAELHPMSQEATDLILDRLRDPRPG